MRQPRYVKTMEQLIADREKKLQGGGFLPSTVSQIVIDFQTDVSFAQQVVPEPINNSINGNMRVVFSRVAMHMSDDVTVEIGSGVFGVHCQYKETSGYYVLHMAMTSEAAVIGGREMYGEPKKIADIIFEKNDNRIVSSISRHGFTYMQVNASIKEEIVPKKITDKAFVYKVFPSLSGDGLEYDPLLVQLNIERNQKKAYNLDVTLNLNESPVDPVADFPVQSILSATYEEIEATSNGEILQVVDKMALFPFLHQRYDDFEALFNVSGS